MPSRCSDKKLYARDTEGVWHVIVPDTGMCAYLRTADGQVVRVKGAAEVRRFAGGKDGEAVVIAATEPPDPALFDLVEPVSVQQVYGTTEVKQAAWTAPEHDLYQRLAGGDEDETRRLTDAMWKRFDRDATGPRFGIGVGPDEADGYPAGFLPADGSLVEAAVHAPLPDPDTAWRLGREGVDAVAAAAVLGLRQAGVPVAKSEQMMRRVRLIADAAEAGMLHRPDSIELDALLMSVHWHGFNRYGRTDEKIDRLMLWLLGRDGNIERLDEATRLLEAAGSWQDDAAAGLLDNPLDERPPLGYDQWRRWRTLLESAAAAGPEKVDQMFGEGAQGWRKAVRWAAGLAVAWDDSDESTAEACMFAVMEGRPEGVPLIGLDLAHYGRFAVSKRPAVDGFAGQKDGRWHRLEGLVSPEGYAQLAHDLLYFTPVRESLAHEQEQIVEATLALLPRDKAIEVAPAGFISRVATSASAQINAAPFADDSNNALKTAFRRWNVAASPHADDAERSPEWLAPDKMRALADLMVDGLAAQAGGQGYGVLSGFYGREVVENLPFMLGDRDDATAADAANAVLRHRAYASLKGRDRLHLLTIPAGRRALDDLTADEQDGLYDRIAKGLSRGHDREGPVRWDGLPDRVQVGVGGRITVADVFANSDTKQCVRAAAAAAVADGLDGDPADPDTHPEWADLLGDTPGGHKVALFATNAAERGDADERTVKEIFVLAPFFRPSNRPV